MSTKVTPEQLTKEFAKRAQAIAAKLNKDKDVTIQRKGEGKIQFSVNHKTIMD